MALLDKSDMTPQERIKVINAIRGKLPIDYSTEMTIIPVEFEEQSGRIPVKIADEEKLQTLFGEVITVDSGGSTHKVVQISTETGTLTNLQKQILQENYSNYIIYDNEFYMLKYKNGQIYRYYTQINLNGIICYIEINMEDGTWEVHGVVDPHPADNVRHITAEERNFWNNKLNYSKVDNERLILDRN